MRILHVTDCYLPRMGGIERQVHDLAVRQRASGHDVAILTGVPGPADLDLTVYRPDPGRAAPGSIRYRTGATGLADLPLTRADVVHVHASTFSPLAYASAARAVRAGTPVAMTLHSLWAYAMPIFRGAHALSGWGGWPIAWSAVSQAAAEPLRSIVGGEVDIVPNGVEAAWWRASVSGEHAGVALCSVMRMSRRKRPTALLAMLRAVRRAVPASVEVRATLLGDGPLLASVRTTIARTALADWVSAPGAASRAGVRTQLADSDIYVAPATLESFGIAALEARCAGLPVVARSATGVVDFIEHGVNGLIAADDAGMVDALVALTRDGPMRERIRAHNLATAPSVTWPDVLSACAELYLRASALTARVRS
ncbi:MAG: glycosyltransferase family 4 protein [Jatrophihabitans sp.]